MKKSLPSLVAVVSLLLVPFSVRGDTEFVIFKAAASIPVLYVEEGQVSDKQLTKMLTSKEIINLSLGRALDFKPADPKTEMLAMAVAYEDDGRAPTDPYKPQITVPTPKTRMIIWNPLASNLADRWVKTIATVTELSFDRLYAGAVEKGPGIATVVIPEGAPVGGTADNKFFAVTFHGTGKLAQTAYGFSTDPGAPQAGTFKTSAFSATGLGGRVMFNFTDKNTPSPGKLINGLAIKGMVTTTGSPLGTLFRNE